MMVLTESQIEDIIYNSPWLLDDNYIIPEIKGAKGQFGRQVNPLKKGGKFIDLLFKDITDERPVIIELKKGCLTRESIGQILEYKSLLMTLEESTKEAWVKEFGRNYYCPKLILIGNTINEGIRIAANLAGVEVRTFDMELSSLDLSTFKEIEKRQQEWNLFRKSGKRAIHERERWINDLLDRINKIVVGFPGLQTIIQVPRPKASKTYFEIGNPFINIPFQLEDEVIGGMYEYFDDQLPFNDDYLYFEFEFVNKNISRHEKEPLIEKVISFCRENNLKYTEYGLESMPIVHLDRTTIESLHDFNKLFTKLIRKAIEIHKMSLQWQEE